MIHFYKIQNGSLFGGQVNALNIAEIESLYHADGWPIQRSASIAGIKFNDLNGNGIKEVGESGLQGWLIHLLPNDIYETTDENGNYLFDSLDQGDYSLNQIDQVYWSRSYPPNPGVHVVTLAAHEHVAGINFGGQHVTGVKDLSISLAAGAARPGFETIYGLLYSNDGSEGVNSSLRFYLPPGVTLVSSNLPGFSYSIDSNLVTWSLGMLSPGSVGLISVTARIPVPPIVNIYDTLKPRAVINPIETDDDPIDNTDVTRQIVQGSFDPNDKLVTPEGIGPQHIISANTELVYQVRFQNTGNDTAFNVVVRDTLDKSLDITTLHVMASSHAYTYQVDQSRELTFTFADINLVDSTFNESRSHGFVSYRIKPRADAVGAVIENKADIYFDYNLPVQTNVVISRVGGTVANQVRNGWNLISLPVIREKIRKIDLFPRATSPAFSYVGTYRREDILYAGSGYWLKFSSVDSAIITDVTTSIESIDVKQGWNLVGSIFSPVTTRHIASNSSGTVMSNFFGYEGGYVIADTIFPGKGYWVKVNQDCKLIFSSAVSTPALAKNRITISMIDELPPSAPGQESDFESEVPKEFVLDQNYPNPFNPTTSFRFALPIESKVHLTIINILGEVVTALVDGVEKAGYRTVEWNASKYASGMYFYRLEATSVSDPNKTFTQVKKMLLVK